MHKGFPRLMVLALVVGGQNAAIADTIPIANASFELPLYGPGGFGPAADWVSSSTAGAYNPGSGINPPDGQQVGFAGGFSNPSSLFQDLGVSVTDGASYQLNLFVGEASGVTSNYLVELLAGSTTIGSASGTFVGDGSFFAISVSANGSGSGDLGIRLSEADQTYGNQTLFDALSLSTASVPEPSSAVLTGIAFSLLGVAGIRARRQRR